MVLEHICPRCGQELIELPWNTTGDVLVCDNAGCEQYRQPQSWIPRKKTPTELQILVDGR